VAALLPPREPPATRILNQMLTVGQVAKRYSLSRSTLLYYDAKGLLKPSGRSQSNYRVYSKSDIHKLERIILFRHAGMSLAAIADILDKNTDGIEIALENRLNSINTEIQNLRNQQSVIVSIIKSQEGTKKTRIVTKDNWVSMLRAAGLDDDGMWKWHIEFERNSPEAHQDFLESIGIPSDEINLIREKSRRQNQQST
jgi:DNA-binding transcriptional MerR regulator